jgi:hypothetical protein
MQCVSCDVLTELSKFHYTKFRSEMVHRFRQSNMSGKQTVSSRDKSTFYEVAQRQVHTHTHTQSRREMIASPNFAEQLVAMINRCRTSFLGSTGRSPADISYFTVQFVPATGVVLPTAPIKQKNNVRGMRTAEVVHIVQRVFLSRGWHSPTTAHSAVSSVWITWETQPGCRRCPMLSFLGHGIVFTS